MNSKSDIGFAVRCRVGIAHRAFRDPNNCGQRFFLFFRLFTCCAWWYDVNGVCFQCRESPSNELKVFYMTFCVTLWSPLHCVLWIWYFETFLFFFEWVPWERGSKKKWIWNFCRCVWLCVFCEGRNSRCWMETCFVIENANFDFYHVFWYLVCYNVFYMNFTIGSTPSSLYIYWARKCGDNIYDDMSIYLFVRYRVRIYSMI